MNGNRIGQSVGSLARRANGNMVRNGERIGRGCWGMSRNQETEQAREEQQQEQELVNYLDAAINARADQMRVLVNRNHDELHIGNEQPAAPAAQQAAAPQPAAAQDGFQNVINQWSGNNNASLSGILGYELDNDNAGALINRMFQDGYFNNYDNTFVVKSGYGGREELNHAKLSRITPHSYSIQYNIDLGDEIMEDFRIINKMSLIDIKNEAEAQAAAPAAAQAAQQPEEAAPQNAQAPQPAAPAAPEEAAQDGFQNVINQWGANNNASLSEILGYELGNGNADVLIDRMFHDGYFNNNDNTFVVKDGYDEQREINHAKLQNITSDRYYISYIKHNGDRIIPDAIFSLPRTMLIDIKKEAEAQAAAPQNDQAQQQVQNAQALPEAVEDEPEAAPQAAAPAAAQNAQAQQQVQNAQAQQQVQNDQALPEAVEDEPEAAPQAAAPAAPEEVVADEQQPAAPAAQNAQAQQQVQNAQALPEAVEDEPEAAPQAAAQNEQAQQEVQNAQAQQQVQNDQALPEAVEDEPEAAPQAAAQNEQAQQEAVADEQQAAAQNDQALQQAIFSIQDNKAAEREADLNLSGFDEIRISGTKVKAVAFREESENTISEIKKTVPAEREMIIRGRDNQVIHYRTGSFDINSIEEKRNKFSINRDGVQHFK